MYNLSLFWPKFALAVNEFCGGVDGASAVNPKVNTALGCIPVRFEEFIPWLMPNLLSIAGGVSFLLMVYGFIIWSTSGGDPKKVQAAKETVTSAISGLLFCIFGMIIFRMIVGGIIKLPGF